MSCKINLNTTEKAKIFADFMNYINGKYSRCELNFLECMEIADRARELAEKEYQQGRADAIDEFLIKLKRE